MFDAAETAFGGVDVLVNNAGIMKLAKFADSEDALFDQHIAINLKGTFNTLREAARRLRDGGRIVNFSSSGADNPPPGLSLYSMTKAGVNMLTRTVAKEYGPYGIRANAVAPGWVGTPMGTHGFRDASGAIDPAKLEEGLRLRRQASPLGVVGVIGPWNYPITNSFGDCIPALMAGNAVILKPSEVTPLSSLLMEEMLTECGLPEHVFQVATGGGATARAIPGARLETITGMGHDLPRPVWPRLIDLITQHAATVRHDFTRTRGTEDRS